MDTRVTLFRLVAALLASAMALPAVAGVLYKSIAADGTIIFSDVPPPSDARIVEQRRILDASSASPAAADAAAPPMLDDDAPIARANALVDLAEHAFAVARRGLWSPADGLRINAARRSRGDVERVEFYKRDVLLARARLLERLRERQMTASLYQVASR